MAIPFDDVITHEDDGCVLTMDNRYYPVVFCHMNGAFTLKSVEFFFGTWRAQLAKYAHSQNEAIVTILVLSSLRPPPATVRKAAGEYVKMDAHTPGLLCVNFVVTNPLMRGVITAIVWIAGSENTNAAYFPTIEDAVRASNKSLEAAGFPTSSLDPSTYQAPTA
ncbi:hypothetical protein [Enhygromyxa salina]|uniref:Uncharacterized protein n=1 Tax=Enhygromyxa salina TaxID=215803 RepID=A0A2S9YVC6_9BACT|nr:hypothetical protein [Enhygromyxa salina]PRQ09057.1 hypothetical protein ENSA7_10470 [Enhygromyxa salina]